MILFICRKIFQLLKNFLIPLLFIGLFLSIFFVAKTIPPEIIDPFVKNFLYDPSINFVAFGKNNSFIGSDCCFVNFSCKSILCSWGDFQSFKQSCQLSVKEIISMSICHHKRLDEKHFAAEVLSITVLNKKGSEVECLAIVKIKDLTKNENLFLDASVISPKDNDFWE